MVSQPRIPQFKFTGDFCKENRPLKMAMEDDNGDRAKGAGEEGKHLNTVTVVIMVIQNYT
jgi:hypothetical protein